MYLQISKRFNSRGRSVALVVDALFAASSGCPDWAA